MNDLFRKEVIAKQSQKHMGDVFLASPLTLWSITFLIASIFVGLICIAALGEYSRKERVVGVLQPSQGMARIIPSQQGYFENIFVSTGDIVRAGEKLINIKNDKALSGGVDLSEAIASQLEIEKNNLKRTLLDIPQEYQLQRQRLQKRRHDKKLESERYTEQIETQSRTVKINEQMFNKMNPFTQGGSISLIESSAAENKYLSAKRKLNELRNTRANLISEMADIDSQIAIFPIEQSKAIAAIKNQISELERSKLRSDLSGGSLIRAPISGTVAAVIARKGQVASPQKVAVVILPKGGKLRAELYVPTRAIGFVKKGQTVRLLYDAYPYQKFGFYNGEIIDVSKTVVQNSDLAIGPNISEPVFIVTVQLSEQSITAYGETLPLQAGMSLSADLILENRKIWEWALGPLLGTLK